MNKWLKKLILRLGLANSSYSERGRSWQPQTDEGKSALYFLETLRDHLMDLSDRSADQIRTEIDAILKDILQPAATKVSAWRESRRYFRDLRIAEVTFAVKSLQDLRSLVWEFVNQIGAEFQETREEDKQFNRLFNQIQDSLESDSAEQLRLKSKRFIQAYQALVQNRQIREKKRTDKFAHRLRELRTELTSARENLSIDHLTKAHNRQAFDEQLARMVNFNQLSGGTSLLLMIDVDHFKKINDTHGHPFGDVVLKEITNLLFRTFPRKTDLICRYGGEEFAVILKDTDHSQAEAVGNRLLETIRGSVLVHKGEKFQFTASIGLSAFEPGDTPETWLSRADQALYQAKHSGRNRYVVASHDSKQKSA